MDHTKHALFLWGGEAFHQPWETSDRFADRLSAHGYRVTLTNDPAVLDDPDMLAKMDLIVLNMTQGDLSEERVANLLAAIRAGTGLGGWHAGLADALRTNTEFQFAVGGQWVAHPGDILDYTVKITRPDDPIMEGITDFAIRSEQYYLHVDPGNEVLATTTFGDEHAPWIADVEMPVVWKKRYGQGKVFYCALGHQDTDFEIREAATIIERGLLWATR